LKTKKSILTETLCGQTTAMSSEISPLAILTRGHPNLQQASHPVAWPDAHLATQIAQMHATLVAFRDKSGFGRAMAAPQVGINKRVIVMNLGATPFVLINPRITWRSTEMQTVWDDCLSMPDCVVRVQRHASINIRYENERGQEINWQQLPADLAELLQHEIDHLDGILMNERQFGAQAVRPISEHAQLVGATRPVHRLSLAQIKASQTVIPQEFLNSPQYNCEPLSEALGCELTIKLDFTNPIRSFKGRGASFFISEMLRKGDQRPIVCASAGNWGQAMAYACRRFGLPIVIYASEHASPLKLARMQALGAQVRQQGHDFDAAKDAAKAYAAQIGGQMIEDGLEPEVSEGHGTLAIELLAQGQHYDAVTIPIGNGAMFNGMACWLKAASPATRVIGVCAQEAPSMEQSWRSGQIVQTSTANTIADGIAVRVPIPEAVSDMQGITDDVLLVKDEHIIRAMQLAYVHAGLLLEPAGAVGLAAIVANPAQFSGKKLATVLCGSNISQAQIETYLQPSRR
jgi:peptide deformylase